MKKELINHLPKTMISELARRLSVARRRVLFVVLMLAALAGANVNWAPLQSARAQSGGMWTTKADMPTARGGLGAVEIDGKLYAVGGNPDPDSILSTLEVYDPVNDVWTTKANMPTARSGFGTAALDGKLYAVAGFGGGAVKLEVYDPATDTWETKADLPTQTFQLAAAAIDGKLYAVGGIWNGNFHSLSVYDPATNTWEARANMPTPRYSLAAAAINGKLYVIGGYNGGALNTLEVYDPATNTWETKTGMPTARRGMAAAAINGKLYVVGGYYKLEVYDPLTDTWTTEVDLPTWRENLGAAAIDGKLYAVGGVSGSRYQTLEVFNPAPPCQAITVSPAAGSLPSGMFGTGYSQQFTQVGGAGVIAWSINPAIPGLSIDSNGLLSGTPTTPGTYNFNVTATDASNCTGSSSYMLIIKADQTITFAALAGKIFGDAPFTVGATSSSGLPVSFSASGSCTISGDTVTIIGAGSCTITATQDGDANYNAAPAVPQSFTIAKAPATLTLGNLSQTYNGSPRSVTVTTDPVNLSGVSVTYEGSTTAPTNAGSYTVVASLNNDNYQAANATGTLVITKVDQTITFAALVNKTYGDVAFAVSATASSSLAVTFSATGSCTVSNTTVTITGAGSCIITASQAGNSNYNAAASVPRTFTIAKASQTITFGNLQNKTFGDAPFTVSATASSGLPVSFTASGACTISGSTVTITGAGTCTITAAQAGNANYNAAPNVSQSYTIAKAAATLTLGNLSQTYNGTPRSVTVTTNPANLTGVSVTYNGSATAPTIAGSYTVVASLNNANYQAANATGTLVIAKAGQTITFAALANKTFGDMPFALSATATSGLTVSFTAGGTCTVSGSTVTITGAGTCTITASQSGNTNYNAAPSVSQSFSIAKATATLTFSNLNPVYTGAPRSVTVTTNPANLTGVNVTYNGSPMPPTNVGSYAVVASLTNANYQASNVTGTLVIAKGNQTINFKALANKVFGDPPFTVSATASSGLAVSFSAIGDCTVAGSTVTITRAGSCTITAAQAGDTNWNAAANVAQSFTIAKANQTITFAKLPDKTYGDAPFKLGATASSGLAVSFTASGACTVSLSTVTLTGAGNCTITATQAGSTNYNTATPVSQSFNIAKANQTITFASLPDKTYGDPSFKLSATASSGLSVSFSATGGCTVSGNTVTLTRVGSCTITASQAGNTAYNAAPPVSQSFMVKFPCQPMTLSITALPVGAVGANYSITLRPVRGLAPFQYTVSGLPSGLRASSTSLDLTIAGVPAQVGTFPVQINVVDANGCTNAGANSFSLVINKGTPHLFWNTPAIIYCYTPLGTAQLNAQAFVSSVNKVLLPGTFVYTPPAGTVLDYGFHILSTVFTPTNTANWNSATASVVIVVERKPYITLNADGELTRNDNRLYTANIDRMVASVTDGCATLDKNSVVVITKVTSDERSDIENDIVIAPDCKSVQLRDERDSSQNGRVYKVTLKVITTGATAVFTMTAPNQGVVIDSGVDLTVKSNCWQ